VDWRAWHRHCDDPNSALARRLEAVRAELARLLAARGAQPTRLLSLCAGDGRDTLPVLAAGHSEVRAVLVEIDPELGAAARARAAELGLAVEVRTADAGSLEAYAGLPPADLLLACGVFGNITDDDLATTIAAFPSLLAPGGAVLWTRGARSGDGDPTRWDGDAADLVRTIFAGHGFVEETFLRPDDAPFRVGVHRITGAASATDTAVAPRPREPDAQLFRFVR
jgi:hypothetical protein